MVCLSSSGFLMRLLSSISGVWWLQRLDQLELDVPRLEAVVEQSALVAQDGNELDLERGQHPAR
jgi:hypothetical protein